MNSPDERRIVSWLHSRLSHHFRKTELEEGKLLLVMEFLHAHLHDPSWLPASVNDIHDSSVQAWQGGGEHPFMDAPPVLRASRRKGGDASEIIDTLRNIARFYDGLRSDGKEPGDFAVLFLEALSLVALESRERMDVPLWLSRWLDTLLPSGNDTVMMPTPSSGFAPLAWQNSRRVLVQPHPGRRGMAELVSDVSRMVEGPDMRVMEVSPWTEPRAWDEAWAIVSVFPSSHAQWESDAFEGLDFPGSLPGERGGAIAGLYLMARNVLRFGGRSVMVVPNVVLMGQESREVRRFVLENGLVSHMYAIPHPWNGARAMWLGGHSPRHTHTLLVLENTQDGVVRLHRVNTDDFSFLNDDTGTVVTDTRFLMYHDSIMAPAFYLLSSPEKPDREALDSAFSRLRRAHKEINDTIEKW